MCELTHVRERGEEATRVESYSSYSRSYHTCGLYNSRAAARADRTTAGQPHLQTVQCIYCRSYGTCKPYDTFIAGRTARADHTAADQPYSHTCGP
jgi:hypothetical protein